MIRIAIFASGGGSNAQRIMEYFEGHSTIKVALVVCNNPKAEVIDKAQKFNVDCTLITNNDVSNPETILKVLKKYNVDTIVLAGYLKKIPIEIIQAFPERIINIHPALLPKYGGKGMYGMNVHKAVKKNGDLVSGPTIHLVNEDYDKGKILFQKKVHLARTDLPEQIATKVLEVEHEIFAPVIEDYLNAFERQESSA